MIGMKTLKAAVVSQVQFLIANNFKLDDHFLNTCISGGPGTGKTSVAKILFKIWNSICLFDSACEFRILHRSDFVGSYMGHTSNKTRKMLEKHSGHCIFLDEAYSLVTGERDEYGHEAIHQLNAFMSEEKGKTIVIIAGYEDEMDKSFFGSNPGLKRRFGWYFSVDKYTPAELYRIFLLQLHRNDWIVADNCEYLFVHNYDKFQDSGGDCENIAFKAKLEYSKRCWNKKKKDRRLLASDVKKGFDAHFVNTKSDSCVNNMYI
jgi:stage V sporulation protein K